MPIVIIRTRETILNHAVQAILGVTANSNNENQEEQLELDLQRRV